MIVDADYERGVVCWFCLPDDDGPIEVIKPVDGVGPAKDRAWAALTAHTETAHPGRKPFMTGFAPGESP